MSLSQDLTPLIPYHLATPPEHTPYINKIIIRLYIRGMPMHIVLNNSILTHMLGKD